MMIWCGVRERQLGVRKIGFDERVADGCADDPAMRSIITVAPNVEVFSLLDGRSADFTYLGACMTFCCA